MAERTNPPRAFISYARADGEAFATALRRRLESEQPEISLWQDRARMEGGVGWWKQITDALETVQFLILVMTPAAMRSEVARKEWRYARQHGVCVYPVKGAPDEDLEYERLPGWMNKAHFFDVELEWETFVNYLKSPCRAVRVPFMAPDLPPAIVHRPALFQKLLQELNHSEDNHSVALTTALRGAGGLGKTTLAAALCHHDEVAAAFDDGILWVTVGQKPNILEGITKLYAALTGKRPAFVDEEDASFNLAQVLEDKKCLIVLDDVWESVHLKPFLRGGPHCSRLITTRNFEIASESRRIDVDEMTPVEAVEMLTARLSRAVADLAPFHALARRLGAWPLLLELAGASLKQRMERGDSVAGALKYLHQKLDAQGVVAFDQRNAQARNQALTRTIELSLEQLAPHELERYSELAVFPEDTEVPLEVLRDLWNLRPFDVEELVQRLDDLSLVKFNLQVGTLHLHDVLRAYLTAASPDLPGRHAKLVAAWPDPLRLPGRYAWRWFTYHLAAAGQTRELRSLLLRFEWLQAKLNSTDIGMLISDFRFTHGDPALELLQGAIRLSTHVLSVDKTQLASQLLGRLSFDSSELAVLRNGIAEWRGYRWLRPLRPFLTAPGGGLLFTLSGHAAAVRTVALTPDGRHAISGSDDHTVRMWSLENGMQERTFTAHTDWVRAVTVTPDGRCAISASDDQTIRVWNLGTGLEEKRIPVPADWPRTITSIPGSALVAIGGGASVLKLINVESSGLEFVLKGHEAGLNSVAVTPDGRFLITASDDRAIKVWNLETRSEVRTLRGHRSKVQWVALTPDGMECVSAGRDDTLRAWKLTEANLDRIVSSDAPGIRCFAVTEAHHAVAACDDGTLKIWDLDDGVLRDVLDGHTDIIHAIALTTDGRYAVSASADSTLKVWDLKARRPNPHADLRDRIRVISISGNGKLAISTSDDRKLRVWDVERQTEIRSFPGHSHWPVAITPDGTRIIAAAGDATIQVLEVETGRELYKFSGHIDRVRVVLATADGRYAISAADDRTIRIWNLETGRAQGILSTRKHWVRSLAVMPAGQRILSGSDDRTVKIWNLTEGMEELTLTGHEARVNSVAVLKAGKYAVSASDDRTLRIWDLENRTERRRLQGHAGRVTAVSPLPDGLHFVSASDDATLKLWNCETGEHLATYTADSPLRACAVAVGGIILAGDQIGIHHFLSFFLSFEGVKVGNGRLG